MTRTEFKRDVSDLFRPDYTTEYTEVSVSTPQPTLSSLAYGAEHLCSEAPSTCTNLRRGMLQHIDLERF
jgi:hypothetical protein